ncbi:unnamed protein product [Sympodiomycopsis kandeliae]
MPTYTGCLMSEVQDALRSSRFASLDTTLVTSRLLRCEQSNKMARHFEENASLDFVSSELSAPICKPWDFYYDSGTNQRYLLSREWQGRGGPHRSRLP